MWNAALFVLQFALLFNSILTLSTWNIQINPVGFIYIILFPQNQRLERFCKLKFPSLKCKMLHEIASVQGPNLMDVWKRTGLFLSVNMIS